MLFSAICYSGIICFSWAAFFFIVLAFARLLRGFASYCLQPVVISAGASVPLIRQVLVVPVELLGCGAFMDVLGQEASREFTAVLPGFRASGALLCIWLVLHYLLWVCNAAILMDFAADCAVDWLLYCWATGFIVRGPPTQQWL